VGRAAVRVTVDGVELYFDVDGAALVPDGERLRERPTLLLLHGGPGGDHTSFKPWLSSLAGECQLVYLDHRGQGRSGGDDPADWNLDRWARDVHGFCAATGIDRPVVLGASFGSLVALRYAADHPHDLRGLVLLEAFARFLPARVAEAFGARHGAEAARAAARFFAAPSARNHERYRRHCHPFYSRQAPDPSAARRALARPQVSRHFFAGEAATLDLRADAARVTCPVLIVNGRDDPIAPVAAARELAAAFPPDTAELVLLADASHDLAVDAPERVLELVRAFIARV